MIVLWRQHCCCRLLQCAWMRVIARWGTVFRICWKWMLDTSTNGTSWYDSWYRALIQMLLDACACLAVWATFSCPSPSTSGCLLSSSSPSAASSSGPWRTVPLSLARAPLRRAPARPRSQTYEHTNTRPTHLVTDAGRVCRKTCSLQLPASIIAEWPADTHFAGTRPCRPHPGRKSG